MAVSQIDLTTDVRNVLPVSNGGAGGGVRVVTSTTDTIAGADARKLVVYNSGSPVAVSLTSPATLGNLFVCWVENIGAGAVTLTPASGTIDGATSLAINANQGAVIWSDGTNFWTERGMGSGGAGAGVASLDGITGPVSLVAGSGITITDNSPSAGNISIAASSGGGGLTLISEVKVSTATPSITFSNIPQTYRHLLLVSLATVSDALTRQDIGLRLNGDTGGDYDRVWLGSLGSGNTVADNKFAYMWTNGASASPNTPTTSELWIYYYTNTTWWKIMKSTTNGFSITGNSSNYDVQIFSAQWRSTAAVTSLTLFDTGTGNINVGSVFDLYGVP